jgi:hypothetical protein
MTWPPRLLGSWSRPVQAVLVGVLPVAFGTACGAVLGGSGLAFLVMQVAGIAGGYSAGLEQATPRAGLLRGVCGGLLFGAAILAGHQLAGGPDHGLLPHPSLLQVAITVGSGALLGGLGALTRQRRWGGDASASALP